MAITTLHSARSPLADAAEQLRILQPKPRQKRFEDSLAESGLDPLRATGIDVLQLNLGRRCNMTCRHCHVDAGPDRREVMSRAIVEACIEVLRRTAIPTVDLTGGAPEMNPHFRRLVEEARGLGRHVIDRSNLTIFLAAGYEDMPEFLARHRVEIVASMPCYLAENVDAQRGEGTFTSAVESLRRLNALGYGQPDSELILTLVYNPPGPSLPPVQTTLEADYRRELKARYGVVFSRLHTITNLPIGRFLAFLVRNGHYDQYMDSLIAAYNPQAAAGVMCRTMLSVDWTGRLHDCDFNQMLELGLQAGLPQTIDQFDIGQLACRTVKTGQHCYGCTAGAGSGCRGAIAAS